VHGGAARIAVKLAALLSAAIVLVGVGWIVVAAVSGLGEGAGTAAIGVAFAGGMTLAVIWLVVFVVYVIQMAFRVLGEP
jgi:hypothetical protein